MQTLVGIIRTEGELRKALEEIAVFKQRLARVKVDGGREFNPGWHLALDLHSMLSVSEAITLGAIERKESRGGHTRDDYPMADDRFGKVNVVIRKRRTDRSSVTEEPLPEMPAELKAAAPGEKVMAALRWSRCGCGAATPRAAPSRSTGARRRRAWWSSTSSTRSRRRRRATSPAAGTARRASAARAAPRSTASRASCA